MPSKPMKAEDRAREVAREQRKAELTKQVMLQFQRSFTGDTVAAIVEMILAAEQSARLEEAEWWDEHCDADDEYQAGEQVSRLARLREQQQAKVAGAETEEG